MSQPTRSQSIKKISRFMVAAGLSSALLPVLLPQQANAEYQYSSQLVQQYNSGCSNQLVKKGFSNTSAQSLCACSLKQMQTHHSQSSAIVILTSAQLNPIKDPKLGLPTNLSKYFTPCYG